MTPQSNFMVLAPIIPMREVKLRELLDSMNDAPGRVNPHNALVPFADFAELHFARLLILDDKTTADIALAYHRPAKSYPLYFTFLGDIDGDADAFRQKLARQAAAGLAALFSCCETFEPGADLAAWMKTHEARPVAAYVNCRGRTVRQVREEAALYECVEGYLARRIALEVLPPVELHEKLRAFVQAEQAAGRLSLSSPEPTPVDCQIRNFLHLVGWPLLALLALPLLLLAAPFYLIALRRLETTDPEICPPVDQAHSENLSQTEDHDVTNQFSAMGTLKPGFIRLATTAGVLSVVDWAARHLVRPGRLGRIRSIHFARWVFVAGTERMIFFSNYDGSVESYMDDFINKTGFGLNASFSNGIGYPRTNWLVFDGCRDERKYKEFLRRHTLPTHVWYKAYPGLTAIDLERNTRLRRGLELPRLEPEQAKEWAALL